MYLQSYCSNILKKVNGETWVLEEYYKVLFSQNEETLIEELPLVETNYYIMDEHSPEVLEYHWKDLYQYMFEVYFYDKNYMYYSQNEHYSNSIRIGDLYNCYFEIISFELNKCSLEFKVSCNNVSDFNNPIIDFPEIKKQNNYILKFVFDGDYFDLFVDNKFVHRFCYISEETKMQYEKLIKDGNCDLSKVTWPRHADGTSEFDDKIIIPEPIITEEDLERFEIEQKRKNLNEENLIIEEISHEIIFKSVQGLKNGIIKNEAEIFEEPEKFKILTATPGTEVKILKIGKEDTKDNITSNWIKIKVTNNAKSVLGVDMKGVTGWIFGGYLK